MPTRSPSTRFLQHVSAFSRSRRELTSHSSGFSKELLLRPTPASGPLSARSSEFFQRLIKVTAALIPPGLFSSPNSTPDPRILRRPRHSALTAKSCWALIAAVGLFTTYAMGQQPQTQTATSSTNAQWANGVAPGYWPTSGAGLTLNLSGGTALCLGTLEQYSSGTLASPSYCGALSSCWDASSWRSCVDLMNGPPDQAFTI